MRPFPHLPSRLGLTWLHICLRLNCTMATIEEVVGPVGVGSGSCILNGHRLVGPGILPLGLTASYTRHSFFWSAQRRVRKPAPLRRHVPRLDICNANLSSFAPINSHLAVASEHGDRYRPDAANRRWPQPMPGPMAWHQAVDTLVA